MIRALIFDCFGVLYLESWRSIAERCSEESQQDLADLERAYTHRFIEESDYITSLSELTGLSRKELADTLAQSYSKNDLLLEDIAKLKKRYSVALLSNTNTTALSKLFSEGELKRLFNTVVLSGEEGIAKPSPEIFLRCAERLGVEPTECLLIDDRAANCSGAEKMGMQSILYKNRKECLSILEKIK